MLGWLPDWLVTRGGSAVALTAGLAVTGHGELAVGVAALAAGVGALEAGHTARRLGRRSRLELLPEVEFTPTGDDVSRVGRLLTGARPRGPFGWAWRSGGVRVRLEAEGGGDVHYTWEADAARSSALLTTARALSRVEVRPADPARPVAGVLAVRELRRSGRAIDTLAGLGEGTDALQIACRTLEELEAGQYGAVLVDLLPATSRHARRQRDRIRRAADLQLQAHAAGTGQRVRIDHQARALAQRLDPDTTLYRVQAFTVGVAETAREAAEIAVQLEAGFAQWTGSARWRRVHSVPAWRRYRAESGLFAPAWPGHVTAREVGAFLRPPTSANASTRVRRSLGALGRPPEVLVPYTGEPQQLPIGAVERRGRRVLLAVELVDDDRGPAAWFSYICGGAGSGKSSLALSQALHVALRTDSGLCFVDPHGDALTELEAFIAGTPAESRLVRVDLGGRGTSAAIPGLNLLDRTSYEWDGGDDWGSDQLLSRSLRDTMSRAMSWTERYNRVLGLVGRAALALAEIGRQVPEDAQPNIYTLERLLLDPGFRHAIAPMLGSASQRAWWGPDGGFEDTPRDVISGVLAMGDRLRNSPPLMALLGQSRATWRARQAMDDGHIVLVRPAEGMDRGLSATVLIEHLYSAAKSRADLPIAQRRPFWLFVDEAQIIDSSAGGVIAETAEELRKYGVRLVVMNQDPGRLSAATRAALGTNRTHMAAGAVRAAAAAYLAGELGGDIHPRAIAKLPNHRFVSTVKVGSVNSGAFVVGSVRPEDVFERRIPAGDLAAHEALRAAVEARTGALRPRVVAAELESLDGRILAALGVSDAPAAELAAATVDRAELPEDRKAAAQELVLGRGMSYAAAGRVLGVSVATIRRDIGRLDARGQTPRPHVLPDPEAGTA